MGQEDGEILWFSPDPRGIFELDQLRISRSLRKTVQRGVFEIRIDSDFDAVLRACAVRHDDEDAGVWITPEIIAVYSELHERGYAHSVESWQGGELVGGLYGVSIGGAFFGESMFHRATDASKVALVALVERMRARGFALLDTQWVTPHLASLGAREIPRREYLKRLKAAVRLPCRFGDAPAG